MLVLWESEALEFREVSFNERFCHCVFCSESRGPSACSSKRERVAGAKIHVVM